MVVLLQPGPSMMVRVRVADPAAWHVKRVLAESGLTIVPIAGAAVPPNLALRRAHATDMFAILLHRGQVCVPYGRHLGELGARAGI